MPSKCGMYHSIFKIWMLLFFLMLSKSNDAHAFKYFSTQPSSNGLKVLLQESAVFTNLRMNKGCMHVIHDEEGDWRVRVSEVLEPYIKVQHAEDQVEITITKDIPNTKVEINTKFLDAYSIALQAGIMNIDEKSSMQARSFFVATGAMEANLIPAYIRKVYGKVQHGVLTNKSTLKPQIIKGSSSGVNIQNISIRRSK